MAVASATMMMMMMTTSTKYHINNYNSRRRRSFSWWGSPSVLLVVVAAWAILSGTTTTCGGAGDPSSSTTTKAAPQSRVWRVEAASSGWVRPFAPVRPLGLLASSVSHHDETTLAPTRSCEASVRGRGWFQSVSSLLPTLRGGSTEAAENDDDDVEQESSSAKASTTTKKKKKRSSAAKAKSSVSASSAAADDDLSPQPNKKVSTGRSTSTSSAKPAEKSKEATKGNGDLSMAILGGSHTRNTFRVFAHDSDEGHSVVGMSEAALQEMGLFEGDTISIKGKRGKKTVASVAMLAEVDVQSLQDGFHSAAGSAARGHKKKKAGKTIKQSAPNQEQKQLAELMRSLPAMGMSTDAMRNAGVRSGDTVTVVPAPHVKFGKAVLILPYKDSLTLAGLDQSAAAATSDQSKDSVSDQIFEEYLKPYFEGKFRTLHRGDSFHIQGPLGSLEFQCVEIDSVEVDGDTSCVVVDDTLIECEGEALERDQHDDLEGAGYDTIGGASKHLAAVRELVEMPLRHPELFQRLGIKPPRGVLLTGPPGSGKTAMARAVAAETGAYFFVINGPEVISKRAGESETNLRRAFEDAEANAEDYNGAIIMIDEIDSIAPRRDKAGGEVEKRIVSQLLTLMDGIKASSKVVVIAATNRPGVIEPALRRPGRFDRELDMGIPDEAGRLEILQIKTRDMRLGNDVDLELLARNTHGYVGADLQQLCMEAALECIRTKMGLIDFDKDRVDKKILDSIVVDGNHFDHAMGIVAPSSLRENQVEIPDVHWEDVGGLEDVKRELHETVQYPVEHADKYIKFGMSPSKGVLFYGPPGCGKTLLAKAIANECGANFISVKGPELLTQWFGESEANVRELFDKARAASPCILMFDEIDSIAKTRGSGGPGSSEAGDRVINQILTEIDGVGARKNVFVIGATNRPDILDPAVIRPGRLDQLIYIPLPDLKSRIAIFKAQLRKAPLDPQVDLEVLARSTHGFSGADIAEICTTASKLAIREAILATEERQRKMESGEVDENDPDNDAEVASNMLITKRHFNFAMSRARRSVSEKDLALFEEFAEKQKAGRGEAASNFRFQDSDDADSGDGSAEEDEGTMDDLYA